MKKLGIQPCKISKDLTWSPNRTCYRLYSFSGVKIAGRTCSGESLYPIIVRRRCSRKENSPSLLESLLSKSEPFRCRRLGETEPFAPNSVSLTWRHTQDFFRVPLSVLIMDTKHLAKNKKGRNHDWQITAVHSLNRKWIWRVLFLASFLPITWLSFEMHYCRNENLLIIYWINHAIRKSL